MQTSRAVAIVVSFVGALAPWVTAAQESNYPGRKPIIVNICPFVQLSGFSFQNKYADRRDRFETNMSWKNIGTQPLTAFEIVILKYDAFDRRLIGERWTVTGVNSADWRPLQPGVQSADGTIGFGTEQVFTAIAYIRAARLADNTVWAVNDSQLITELRKVIPGGQGVWGPQARSEGKATMTVRAFTIKFFNSLRFVNPGVSSRARGHFCAGSVLGDFRVARASNPK